MFSPLKDHSDPAVTTAIERNNIDLFLFAAARGGKTIVREEGFTGVIGKPCNSTGRDAMPRVSRVIAAYDKAYRQHLNVDPTHGPENVNRLKEIQT